MKALEPERVTARQIEAARRALTRHMKRAGRVWIRIFRTCRCRRSRSRSAWARARARRNIWAARVKPGRIIFEIDGVSVALAREALALAAAKLPIKTRFVERIAE